MTNEVKSVKELVKTAPLQALAQRDELIQTKEQHMRAIYDRMLNHVATTSILYNKLNELEQEIADLKNIKIEEHAE